MAISAVYCEHLVNPLGIETPAPRLSWRLASDRRGARQLAYRLLVASTASNLANGNGDLWDSARVESDASVLVPYAGVPLTSRQCCWWRVSVWDETGQEHVSDPAWWEMGLLDPHDWQAQWIAADTPTYYHGVPAAPLLRTAFQVTKPIRAARAYVCGLGFYEFFLNGQKVSDAVLHPAFTKYDARALYTVYDITDALRPGANAAGMCLGTGWYHHHTRDVWNLYAAPWVDGCKALVQIEVRYADGSAECVCSNHDWQTASGPILFDGLRNGEIYDARLEQPGWHTAAFDASTWSAAQIARHPGGHLRAQIMQPCRVTATLRPVSVQQVHPGVWVYDMGRNIAGWARLTLSGPAGTTVTLRYAEQLGPDGDINQAHIKQFVQTGEFQTDTYILHGNGPETYEPRFAYHGFQYVQVSGLPGAATLDMLTGCVVHTDVAQIGTFTCSNDLINKIQQAAVAATMGNYHGIPTDCPHREKNGWTGDAQLSAEQMLFNFDLAAPLSKWLEDFRDCQRPSGAFPGIVPTGGWGYNWGAGPAWDSAYLMIPWYLYLYRGDIEILRRHYDGMQRYLEFLSSLASDGIVQFGLGDWCPPGPRAEGHKAPAELTNTAYYYADARLLAQIAALLGHEQDAVRYNTLAQQIKAAARQRFYDPHQGRLSGHSQTAIACFLYQGLIEPDEREAFARMLLNEIAACNDHIDCGILGAKYVLNILTELGHPDVAYRIATQPDYPGWGAWIAQGATTLWETWDGNASRNHHMFSDISAWFYKTLAGILPDPQHPGFKHSIIKPWPLAGLTDASGSTETPYGTLHSSWRREDGRVLLDICIPPNSSASIHLPASDPAVIHESGQPLASAEGVQVQGVEQGRVVCRVGAGTYRFVVYSGE